MITSRTDIVTLVFVAAVLVLAALSGEPIAERAEHGCWPPRTMPPVLSRLRRAVASVVTACRTALGLEGLGYAVACVPAFAQTRVAADPVPQLRI